MTKTIVSASIISAGIFLGLFLVSFKTADIIGGRYQAINTVLLLDTQTGAIYRSSPGSNKIRYWKLRVAPINANSSMNMTSAENIDPTFPEPTQQHIKDLIRWPETAERFDEVYGEGAARKILDAPDIK